MCPAGAWADSQAQMESVPLRLVPLVRFALLIFSVRDLPDSIRIPAFVCETNMVQTVEDIILK